VRSKTPLIGILRDDDGGRIVNPRHNWSTRMTDIASHKISANSDAQIVHLPKIKAGFVGFGEVNSPRDLIERKVAGAREALERLGLELVTTGPVSEPEKTIVRKQWPARLLIVCLAGWIPSHRLSM
jgi:hypothetical protein